VLNGEVGQFVTIARQERDTERWFVGSITNEESRNIIIKTDFLTPNVKYNATIYADGENAHWDLNPTSFKIEQVVIDSNSEIKLSLACGGGAAISIEPVE
jgi:hypothetical protein